MFSFDVDKKSALKWHFSGLVNLNFSDSDVVLYNKAPNVINILLIYKNYCFESPEGHRVELSS